MKTIARLVLLSAALFCAALSSRAQELATPVQDGSNTAITVKPLLRMWRVQMDRGGNIEIQLERVRVNNATDAEIGSGVKIAPIVRSIATMKANSVAAAANPPISNREIVTITIGGQDFNVTFTQFLLILEAFYTKWAAETPPAP